MKSVSTNGSTIIFEIHKHQISTKRNFYKYFKTQKVIKTPANPKKCGCSLVPPAGIEPAQYRYRGILSPLRLPVPPWRRSFIIAERAASVKPRLSRRECAQNSGRRVQIACVRLKIALGQNRIIGQERFASQFCVLTRRGFAVILDVLS